MTNFYHKHLQCFANQTISITSKYKQGYFLLAFIVCANLAIGIIILLGVLFKTHRRNVNNKKDFELLQTMPWRRIYYISFSSPPALSCFASAQQENSPTAKSLETDSKDETDADGERLQDYGPGGYMACVPGQIIGPKKQYSIIRKLGWGHYSTVWLCENNETKEYQAIKISKSALVYTVAACDEISLLEQIRQRSPQHAAYDKIILLRDHFTEQSMSTGLHTCIAFDVMGPTLWELLVDTGFKGFPQPAVKAIIRQVLMALTYLHDTCQIIHTDIKPENILVSVSESYIKEMADYAKHFFDKGVQMPRSYVSTLLWKDHIDVYGDPNDTDTFVSLKSNATETHDDSTIYKNKTFAQQYTNSRFPLPIFVDKNIKIKLADLGNSCYKNQQFFKVIQTVQYRALEVLLQSGYSFPADLWSVACVAFEISTGEYLFNPQESATLTLVEDHLGLIWEALNGIPEYIATGGRVSKHYFNSTGQLKRISPSNLKIWKIEDVLVDKYKWRRVDAILLGNFIQLLIEPDPILRATASGALELEWLKE